jgi:hypothetical protein
MKANVYVDGFNLYYGAVKNTPYLCMRMTYNLPHLATRFPV